MHPIGYNTGALYGGDWARAVEELKDTAFTAIEIGLLREHEFFPFVENGSHELDLSMFSHISVHAPKLEEVGLKTDVDLVEGLKALPEHWDIVHHPDNIKDFSLWAEFGSRLRLENMDTRKASCQNVEDMEKIFIELPEASMCFDIAHAEQVDGTMELGKEMCLRFSNRIKEIHISKVLHNAKHVPMDVGILKSFSKITKYLPEDCPIIIESNPLTCLCNEITFIKSLFPTYGLKLLWRSPIS